MSLITEKIITKVTSTSPKAERIDYFYCINGECSKCRLNTTSITGCGKYDDCKSCIAQNKKFCDVCINYNKIK